MYDSILLVPLMPLIGFLILSLAGSKIKNEKIVGIIGSSAILISFLVIVNLIFTASSNHLEEPAIVKLYTWFSAGDFSVDISYQVDQLSLFFGAIITGVGFLIHVYSIGYMHGDRRFHQFFSYLNLFVFMMLNLVLASNFLLTFLGWEGVGLASYLLIGFWYDQKFQGFRITWTGDAANKAFIMNRVGDFGMLVAIFLTFTTFGTLEYSSISDLALASKDIYYDSNMTLAITLLIFLGCTGKSAQIPLAGWLPDAMAGPTSVSALIHAATMVTAGVFLIARNNVLFALSPDSLMTVGVVGAVTAILAASVGLVQNDIKKVLAYSTVSQLGFMFAALGVGQFTAGLFHTMTHAFFKACLFLGAGSVIHGMHHEQDIKKMGGLRKYMPHTFKTFYIATLAIAGIPFFSGFFSKDEILFTTYKGNYFIYTLLVIAAVFTAFYMFRLVYLTFYGKERFDAANHTPHESPGTMTGVLWALAGLSILGGFLNVPHIIGHYIGNFPSLLHDWFHPVFGSAQKILAHGEHSVPEYQEWLLMMFATILAVGSWQLARAWYRSDENWTPARNLVAKFPVLYKTLWEKWYLDQGYFKFVVDPVIKSSRSFFWKILDVSIIDGLVNGLGTVTKGLSGVVRRFQTGVVQAYAGLMIFGIIIILYIMVK
ncbi:NADH-quinone oxidoreductase subunit L [Candidatus Kapabacteria bacterium]|nr:NADH-quinone oxidoreductase subunit L [Candidatus Kapabacteria bacterium]